MKTPAYLQQFINKAALPLWKSNLWLRSLSSDSCQIELRPFLGEQVSASLKPPPPLALIAVPVGTLRKETGGCLGHGDFLSRSLLQVALLVVVLPWLSDYLPWPLLAWCMSYRPCSSAAWAGSTGEMWPAQAGEQTAFMGGERRKLFIRQSKFINFPLPLSIYFSCPLTSLSSLLFLPFLPSVLHYYCQKERKLHPSCSFKAINYD